MAELEDQFVLVPRSPSGGITRAGQELVKGQLGGGTLAFDREEPGAPGRLPPKARAILEEFKKKLPKGIKLDANPFVVLKVERRAGAGVGKCLCQCGSTFSCGGGGGGGSSRA
jgi:hypothetical protein